MSITRVSTNEICPHCGGDMDKAIDTMKMIQRYICNECGAQYEAHPEKAKGKVGDRVVEPKTG